MSRRVAITGAGGQLGRQLVRVFEARGDVVIPFAHGNWQMERPEHVERISASQPDLVVNAAAWTDVDGCARDPGRATRVNGTAAGAVAAAAGRVGTMVVQISTNEVFDGTLERSYFEDDSPAPVNAYGASKLFGERAVAHANPNHLIVRTAWIFGPGGTNFVTKILAAAARAEAQGAPLNVVDDEWGNPTWAPSLAEAIAEAIDDGRRGVLHLAGTPPVSRYAWAEQILGTRSRPVALEPISRRSFARASSPPARAILGSRYVPSGLDWESALRTYVTELDDVSVARRR